MLFVFLAGGQTNDNLRLDTGTLEVTTLLDHDKATQINGQVGITPPGAPGKLPGVNVQGSYASHDTEQETRGMVVIRDKANHKQDRTSHRPTDQQATSNMQKVLLQDEIASVTAGAGVG